MAKVGNFDFYCEEAISGKTPVKKVYESEKVLAFYHTRPKYKIHIILVPKEHIHDILSLKEEHKDLILEIVEVIKKIATTLNIEKDGLRLMNNLGKYQDTPHLHFHLVSDDNI
ncbi:MAG: HIT domain-containing protein [Candidatus Curtissbacteria bacterium]|nr:HIT domain-containing protein [Candidatus Curtissbacteria bacterium]